MLNLEGQVGDSRVEKGWSPGTQDEESSHARTQWGTTLVAQWLRIHLPMQGTRVRALVKEDPTCRGATKPVRHNY